MCSRRVLYLLVLMCVIKGTESEIITDNGLRVKYSTAGTILVTGCLLQSQITYSLPVPVSIGQTHVYGFWNIINK